MKLECAKAKTRTPEKSRTAFGAAFPCTQGRLGDMLKLLKQRTRIEHKNGRVLLHMQSLGSRASGSGNRKSNLGQYMLVS